MWFWARRLDAITKEHQHFHHRFFGWLWMHQIQLDYLVLYLISSFVWYRVHCTMYMCIYRSNGIEKLFSFIRMIQLIWRENLFHAFSVGSVFSLFLSFLFVEMHYQDEKESFVWILLEISIRISPEYKHAPNRKDSSSFLFGFACFFSLCVPLRKNLWQIFTLFEKFPSISAIDHKMQRAQFVELLVQQSNTEQGYSIWKSYFHPLFSANYSF